MNDNVVVVGFAETSKAYEALSVLERLGDAGDLVLRSLSLLERGRIEERALLPGVVVQMLGGRMMKGEAAQATWEPSTSRSCR
jgi:hypothetical protein